MIKYVKGDATKPQGDGTKIIVHVCNDIGAWGAGFVLALSKMSPEPEKAYRESYRSCETPFLPLGTIGIVGVSNGIFVCNMVAQHGTVSESNPHPLSYIALAACLKALQQRILCSRQDVSVHMPRIGCGLAGGRWEMVESIIDKTLVSKGISVTVYDL